LLFLELETSAVFLKVIDEMGNYTLGIREHTIFPETADEDIKDVFGLAVTVVTSSKDKEANQGFFEASRLSVQG
jgi:large subunit ribosomal protein L5